MEPGADISDSHIAQLKVSDIPFDYGCIPIKPLNLHKINQMLGQV